MLVLLRGCVIAVLAGPVVACTSILGIPDAELECYVEREYPHVASNSTTKLAQFPVTPTLKGPQLTFTLAPDFNALLYVKLYEGFAQHTVLYAPGTYQLTAGDADSQCGICVFVNITKPGQSTAELAYQANEGTLELIRNDNVELIGTLRNLQFRHIQRVVNGTTSTSVEIKDGCAVSMPDVEFDMTYPP